MPAGVSTVTAPTTRAFPVHFSVGRCRACDPAVLAGAARLPRFGALAGVLAVTALADASVAPRGRGFGSCGASECGVFVAATGSTLESG